MSGATRVGIVGAGPMGRLHAKTVSRAAEQEGRCVLSTIIDRHRGRADVLAADFDVVATDDLEAALSDLDAVIVAAPTSSHYSLTRHLLERGFDVFVEKPLAGTIAEAETLARLARARNGILQVGHVEWFNRGWREAARLAGPARSIFVERLNPRSSRGRDIDVVQDFMLHDLDWVTRWIGEDIVELEAEGRSVECDGLDEAEVRFRFRSGCRVRLRASRIHAERRRVVRIEGVDGKATADLLSRRVLEFEPSGAEVIGEIEAMDPCDETDPLGAQWNAFLNALESRRAPETDGSVGVATLRIVERVRGAIAHAGGNSIRDDDSTLSG